MSTNLRSLPKPPDPGGHPNDKVDRGYKGQHDLNGLKENKANLFEDDCTKSRRG